MSDKNVAWTSPDYPVAIEGTLVKRAQSFNIEKLVPTTNTYQLGTQVPTGVVQDAATHRGRLTTYCIDNSTETLWGGTTLASLLAASGKSIVSPKGGLTGAKLQSLEYAVRVGGFFQCTMTFEGTASTSGSPTLTGETTPTGAGAYRARDVVVSVGGTTGSRLQGVTVRGTLRAERVEELGNANPAGYVYNNTEVTVDLDWAESDAMAPSDPELTLSSPGDIVINVGNGAKIITIYDCVSSAVGKAAQINGIATRRYSYRAKGNEAEQAGGMALS